MNNLHLSWPLYSKDLIFDSKVYGTTIKKQMLERKLGIITAIPTIKQKKQLILSY